MVWRDDSVNLDRPQMVAIIGRILGLTGIFKPITTMPPPINDATVDDCCGVESLWLSTL
jgi:hypothetical protein